MSGLASLLSLRKSSTGSGHPMLTPDKPGTYVVRLTVSDGRRSRADSVNVSALFPSASVPIDTAVDGVAPNGTKMQGIAIGYHPVRPQLSRATRSRAVLSGASHINNALAQANGAVVTSNATWIGVPGFPAGTAWERMAGGAIDAGHHAGLDGFLAQDDTNNYNYLARSGAPFDLGPDGASSVTMKVGAGTYTASLPAGAMGGPRCSPSRRATSATGC